MTINDYFDRVVVINLRRRADRLVAFREDISSHGWPFKEPEVFDAIDGSKVPVPNGWAQGGGTWGCLQSHRQVLERAIMDNVRSLLVLEDDVYIIGETFVEDCRRFLESVPKDWDQLMLGGQHMATKMPISPGVVKANNCQRTHAYAIRGRFLRDLYATWCSHVSVTHCDHIMGPMQGRYRVYAPDPFLFGQTRGQSDINGRVNPAKAWVDPTGNEYVLVLDCHREVVAELREYGVHTGYERDKATDIDVGLVKVFASGHPEPLLRRWIVDLQWECVSEPGTVLGVWHPKANVDLVKRCWNGPVKLIKATTIEEAVQQLPVETPAKIERPSRKYLIVLHAERQTAGMLRGLGWHMGNWRDPVSDLDNGLREWAVKKNPEKLREVVEWLTREASAIKNGVACIWHPDVTKGDVEAVTKLTVVEIRAYSVEEAIAQWENVRHGEQS